MVAGLDEAPLAPTHGDLKPAHILLDGDRVGVIDFDLLAGADPVQDVANLLFELSRGGGRVRQRRNHPRARLRVFAEEHFAHVPESWRARLPYHYAAVVLTAAATVWGGQRARGERSSRTEQIAAMVQEAKEALAGRL